MTTKDAQEPEDWRDVIPPPIFIDADTLAAAGMLDDPEAPELTEEQFEELVGEMRDAREQADAEGSA